MKTARTQEILAYFDRIGWLEEIVELADRLVGDFTPQHFHELRDHIESLKRYDEKSADRQTGRAA